MEGDLSLVVTGGWPERRAEVVAALDDLPAAISRGSEGAGAIAHIAPNGVWGPVLRARISALRPGDRFRATADPASLRELLEMLDASEVALNDDEVRALGLVLVLDEEGRVGAAHLLRPVERDAAGHLQRRPPAVLAARDPQQGALEHFTWAVTSELADRVDRSQSDFEARQTARARLIDHLAARPASTGAGMALEAHVAAEPPRQPAPERAAARPPWSAQDGHRPH